MHIGHNANIAPHHYCVALPLDWPVSVDRRHKKTVARATVLMVLKAFRPVQTVSGLQLGGDAGDMLALEAGTGQFVVGRLARAVAIGNGGCTVGTAAGDG